MKHFHFFDPWLQRWQLLGARDRRVIVWGGGLLGLALLWGIALGPAITTLRETPARIAAEFATLERLQAMAHEAQALQPQATIRGTGSAMERLRQASDVLGEQAQISTQGNRLVVSLFNVAPEALGPWLAHVRKAAHLKPHQASLRASATGTWSGTLMFQIEDGLLEN